MKRKDFLPRGKEKPRGKPQRRQTLPDDHLGELVSKNVSIKFLDGREINARIIDVAKYTLKVENEGKTTIIFKQALESIHVEG